MKKSNQLSFLQMKNKLIYDIMFYVTEHRTYKKGGAF